MTVLEPTQYTSLMGVVNVQGALELFRKKAAASGAVGQSPGSGRRSRQQGAGQSDGAISCSAAALPAADPAARSPNAGVNPARDGRAAADSALMAGREAQKAAVAGPQRGNPSSGAVHNAASGTAVQALGGSASGGARTLVSAYQRSHGC